MFKRKYQLNEDIFETINNEEKAYWLGFLSADGNITENKIRLQISMKDYNHLLKYKIFTGWTGRVYYKDGFNIIDNVRHKIYKSKPSAEVSFRSNKMIKDLSKYGIVKNKTYTLFFPSLPIKMIRHYIRGYFDGDGCANITFRKTKKPSGKIYIYENIEFSILGNKNFLSKMSSVLAKDVGIKIAKIEATPKNIYRIRYGGINQINKIYHYLYDDATVFLIRKKNKIKSVLLHRERLNETALILSEATVRTA